MQQHGFLGDVTDHAAPLHDVDEGERYPVQQYLARLGLQQANGQVDDGGFAGTRWPHQGGERPGAYIQVEVSEYRMVGIVTEVDALQADGLLEAGSGAAVQVFPGAVGGLDGLHQRPVGALALGQFLVLLLHLAEEGKRPPQRHHQHHDHGQVYGELLDCHVDAQADEAGKHQFLG